MEIIDYNKYENYIRVGNSAASLKDFPTPSTLTITLHDVDKDAYTDLKGKTHRNRVRHDVYDIQLGYSVLSDADLAFILNAISNQWIYIEVPDAKQVTHTTNGSGYWKLIGKTDGATYWYNKNNGTIYNNSSSTTGVSQDINDYTQVVTPVRTVHKVYASDKAFDTYRIAKNSNNQWETVHQAFSVTLVEE